MNEENQKNYDEWMRQLSGSQWTLANRDHYESCKNQKKINNFLLAVGLISLISLGSWFGYLTYEGKFESTISPVYNASIVSIQDTKNEFNNVFSSDCELRLEKIADVIEVTCTEGGCKTE